MREDKDGLPHTYWIVHATSLLRVAPEHLRPTVEDDGRDLHADLQAATRAAETVRARSTTQYTDLRNQEPIPMDVDTDDDDTDTPDAPQPEV